MKQSRTFLLHIALLTGTSLLMRTVGMTFTVYLSDRVGSYGVGVYHLIQSVYAFAATAAIAGIRFGTTRLAAEQLGLGHPLAARRTVLRCMRYAITFGTLAGVGLYFGAKWIGTQWLSEPATIPSLRLLAFTLPFVSVSASLGGCFNAIGKVRRCAAMDILNQFVRILVAIQLLTLLLPKGIEYACIALVLGTCAAEGVTFLYSLVMFWHDRHTARRDNAPPAGVGRIVCTSLPVGLGACARTGLSTLQNVLIPAGLRRWGMNTQEALTAYGLVHGMALPVILYPSALLYVLGDLLLPVLTQCQVRGEQRRLCHIVERVMKFCLLFSVGIMTIMLCCGEELAVLIYDDASIGWYLQLLSPLLLIMYMDAIVDAFLKGLGEQFNSMKYNIIDSSFSVVLVSALIPTLGIHGYLITIMSSEVLNFSLSLHKMLAITEFSMPLSTGVFFPLLCAGSAMLSCRTMLVLWKPVLSPLTAVCAHITLLLGLYALFLFVSGCLTRQDLHWLRSLLTGHPTQQKHG